MQEPISNLEEKVNPSILKYDFFSRTDPSIFTIIALELLDWSMLFPEMHAIVHAQTGTYTSKITSALHHMRKIIVFSLLFCCYYMFPVRIMFPNVMWTLHGKTFCLNFLAECLKQPSKIDLCFKSKYFVISVADQLNQNSFMNC